jgi:archaellum biogenesis ATPase FlaH
MTASEAATALAHSGISVIPVNTQTKRPPFEWLEFQSRIPSDAELVQWFATGKGIAAVCGPISGGLEVLDFDIPGKHLPEHADKPPAYGPWKALLKEHGYEDLLKRLIAVKTPSGGIHIVYRCPGAGDGNLKLAMRTKTEVLIETRGKGGYFLIPPTDGYVLLSGSFDAIPIITEAEREILHTCARMLNEHWDKQRYERNVPSAARPGDAYNLNGPSWEELLGKHGWKIHGRRGQWVNFTRPDKNEGVSAGYNEESGLFHVFSSSTAFELGKGYSKFSAYCVLEHSNDFFRAAQELGRQGYGGDPTKPAKPYDIYGAPKYATCEPLSQEDEEELWGTIHDVEALEVEWFWTNRIPLGALTMIQGDPGLGKSFITAAIAATASVGGVFPCGQKIDPCHVVFVSTEDDPRRVLRPRFEALGANLKQISILATDKKREDGTPVLGDRPVTIDMIFARVKVMGAKLLILDPLIETMAALGIDVNKSNEVRPILAKIRNLAAELNCAVIIVHHQNKMSGSKSLYRSVGSIDIPAAMRSVFAVGVDPDDPGIRALAHVKSNWSALQATLGYDVDEFGVFGWVGESELTADDMSQPVKPKAERQKSEAAKSWLREMLKDGPMNSVIIQSKADELGYGRRVMDAAGQAIPVYKWKVGGRNQESYWLWSLKAKEDSPYDPMSDF